MRQDRRMTPRPPRRLIAAVAGLHVLGLCLLAIGMAQGTLLLGLGGLAYLLGMRHAFDIDHIAAIDNVTRKLTGEGRSASFVGFAFSLGHSTVVFVLCAVVVASAGALAGRLDGLAALGGVIGTVVSATFLSIMAALNTRLLWRIWQRFSGRRPDAETPPLSSHGPFGRLVARGTGWIDTGWKMYPLGFVFGLGFDTATEVALLGLSAGAAQHAGWSPWVVMALPLLFAAGMTTLDSLNGLVMQRAYRWGGADRRRLGFNLAITGLSIAVAAIVAAIEWTGFVADHVAASSPVATVIDNLPSAGLGLAVFVAFVVFWGIAARRRRESAT
ncbi:HoxN/HupN/NixA family nickel/cobalt transporter [Salinisphaera sp. Q1T1-3]|uniref:HoxN/HupN/NixA family nickel/cobalt transporter n=1 Tax=Salinisphaera sp. Q1T1-3 TaxID=2321229 RepID=UPI0013144DAA|nr:HoxN/HupN/NixA family nickel/cobalt transporter [Salinisphaera sp. Q1T1-3]